MPHIWALATSVSSSSEKELTRLQLVGKLLNFEFWTLERLTINNQGMDGIACG